jgi:phage terminase large subunit-like protein
VADALPKLARFTDFTAQVETVEGSPFELDDFQREILLAYFAGYEEILILIPKGNGKTTLLAALAVFHLLTAHQPEGYIGAATVKQANKMYREALRISQLRPEWRRRLFPRAGTRELRVGKSGSGGLLQVLASDKLEQGSLEGIAPTLGLVDELHAHLNDAIYAAIHGALQKRGGRIVTISTAGEDEDSVLGRLRAGYLAYPGHVKRDFLTLARSPSGRAVMFEWMIPAGEGTEDMGVVERANPLSQLTAEHLGRLRGSPSMTEARWQRYHCGRWVAAEGTLLAHPGAWNACEVPGIAIPLGVRVYLGLDPAKSYDSAALVVLWPREREPSVVTPTIWRPEDHRGEIPLVQVERTIHALCERYDVRSIAFDKQGGWFRRSAEVLADEYDLPMLGIDMGSATWAPITAALRQAIASGSICHPGDAEFSRQVRAGQVKDSAHGERLHGRVPGSARVDGVMALGLAWHAAFDLEDAAIRPMPFVDIVSR